MSERLFHNMKNAKEHLMNKFEKMVDNLPDNFGVISGNISLMIVSTISDKINQVNHKETYIFDTSVLNPKPFTRFRERMDLISREMTKKEVEYGEKLERPH